MKVKKILVLFFVLFGTLCLTSCTRTRELERAMNELTDTSFTANIKLGLEVKISYDADTSVSQSTVSNFFAEVDQNSSYGYLNSSGRNEYYYTYIEDSEVKSYTSHIEGRWNEAYSDSSLIRAFEMLDVQIEDAFTKNGDVWVGDVKKINEELTELLEDYLKNVDDDGQGMSLKITKYEITLNKNKVEKVDIELLLVQEYEENKVEATIKLPMVFSKIDQTEVTVPDYFKDK